MLLSSLSAIIGVVMVASVIGHGPPGVPPNAHQPPVQQQQQQFQQQQQNVKEGHHHAAGNKLKFQSDIHNAEHIMEHLQNVIKTKPKEEMSEEELEFHYFKMHDYDNNNKLDGVEIGKALTHFHEEETHQESKEPEGGNSVPTPTSEPGATVPPHPPKDPSFPDEKIADLVDNVLQMFDSNNDGYVTYFEYRTHSDQKREQPDAPQASP